MGKTKNREQKLIGPYYTGKYCMANAYMFVHGARTVEQTQNVELIISEEKDS